MTDEQIYHMATRFLGWKLPKEFHPDAGISFKPTFNDHMPTPMRHEPTGTNLLDYSQTIEMVRYIVEGLPVAQPAPPSDVVDDLVAATKGLLELIDHANEGAFKNGVTDQTGSIDEGEVIAADLTKQARLAIEAMKGQVR